jgi:20S proteasome subunit beta 2
VEAQHECTSVSCCLDCLNLSHVCPQREDALALVTAAIQAGIFNDLGSGSNVDACVITASHTEMLRNWKTPNERVEKEKNYKFRQGTTAWSKEDVRDLIVDEQVLGAQKDDAMDVS